MRGTTDLLLEMSGRRVIIDHKSFPLEEPAVVEKHAATFAGQLGAYADTVRAASGIKEVEAYVHFPVSGCVVQLTNTSEN